MTYGTSGVLAYAATALPPNPPLQQAPPTSLPDSLSAYTPGPAQVRVYVDSSPCYVTSCVLQVAS